MNNDWNREALSEVINVPLAWLPEGEGEIKRVIIHWTGGTYEPNRIDLASYNFVVDGKGVTYHGVPVQRHFLKDWPHNRAQGTYAAHTRRLNGGSVGVAACGMKDAVEDDTFGDYPIKQVQFEELCETVASICLAYNITIGEETVLTHAEVDGTLGVRQRSKWDYNVRPWQDEPDADVSAFDIGDDFRALVTTYRDEMIREITGGHPAKAEKAEKADFYSAWLAENVPTLKHQAENVPIRSVEDLPEIYTVTAKSGLRLRSRPSIESGPIMATYPLHSIVERLRIVPDVEGWVYVVTPGGNSGWMAERWLQPYRPVSK